MTLNAYGQPIIEVGSFEGEHVVNPMLAGLPPVCTCGWTPEGHFFGRMWVQTGASIGDHLRDVEDGEGGITLEGQELGHRYVMGNVNCYCPKCSDEQGVCVLDCDYDLDK